MFLNDAFGNCEDINCIYTHHKLAMAALGYSKSKGLGVCVTTTGCGATNARQVFLMLGKTVNLFYLYQAKQRKRNYILFRHSMRSFGVQELDIIPIVKPLTKKNVLWFQKRIFLMP